MQTRFSAAQLQDPGVATSEPILRKCVHCGFCTATCPTYVLLGDELDSPRGRIYLIKEMLENGRPASAEVALHVDRCLSCLACMTTCPSGVHYQHLIDHARVHVERTYRRPVLERGLRALLAVVLPYPRRFAAALALVPLARPFARVLPARLRAMLELVPARPRPNAAGTAAAGAARLAGANSAARRLDDAELRGANDGRRVFAALGARRARVGFLTGCVQTVLEPGINAATIRVLTRAGCEVVTISGCCGSLVHHLGRERAALEFGTRVLEQVGAEVRGDGLDALVANASGCGTHAKDYGHLFRNDALAVAAAEASARARDVTELLAEIGLPPVHDPPRLTVAYHSACSMQHGQKIEEPPRALLRQAGFVVREIAEAHLCCGSAGTYNILQPEIAARLRERKLANVARTGADIVATGNIGCITQLAAGANLPVAHTIELLDWATGGPTPPAWLARRER
jgi:glycolate oxidase iron-sulfur subunit